LLLTFFFGVGVFNVVPPFCFSAETSMSRVSLNGGSGFSRDEAHVTRIKLPSESGFVLSEEEWEGETGESQKIRASWW
jgi:hypothetical protein